MKYLLKDVRIFGFSLWREVTFVNWDSQQPGLNPSLDTSFYLTIEFFLILLELFALFISVIVVCLLPFN